MRKLLVFTLAASALLTSDKLSAQSIQQPAPPVRPCASWRSGRTGSTCRWAKSVRRGRGSAETLHPCRRLPDSSCAISPSCLGLPLRSVVRIGSVVLDAPRIALLRVQGLVCRNAARLRDGGERFSGGCEDRCLAGQVHDPPHNHIAIGRADLAAVTGPVEQRRCGHRRSAPHERIEDHIARSEERRVGKECRYRWSPYH